MVGQRGKPKGLPKSGGAVKGSKKKFTTTVKQAIAEAFHRKGGVEWLIELAEENPQVFAGLVAKLVPAEVNAEIHHTARIDLGRAMADADARLAANREAETLPPFKHDPDAYTPSVIDVTPEEEAEDDD